jgi:transcriptional regulator with XRE-family HTH domain
MPTLMEEIRRAHGSVQRDLASVLGYSQAWTSNVLRRQQALTIDQVRDIANRLNIPMHLLGFGGQGGDDPTNRRELGKSMTLALLPLPKRAQVDETTAPTLTAITGAQRRLDATAPARELSQGVTAHVTMANRLLERSQRSPFAAGVAAAISEAAGFAAWLHGDMHDIGTARSYYRMAIDRARFANNGLLAGYMLGSLAAFEIEEDDPSLGLTLVDMAKDQIGTRPHPTADAWLKAIKALGHASARKDAAKAHDALSEAEQSIERSDNSPPWPWVFPFSLAKLSGYRALVAVRLGRPSEALAAFSESIPATQPAPKQRAVIMLEVATAVRQAGETRRDRDQVGEAFRLANEALTIGVNYSSERVIQRARRFRRNYNGPAAPGVQEFDRQLRTTLP